MANLKGNLIMDEIRKIGYRAVGDDEGYIIDEKYWCKTYEEANEKVAEVQSEIIAEIVAKKLSELRYDFEDCLFESELLVNRIIGFVSNNAEKLSKILGDTICEVINQQIKP